jgi:hypothetical protein
LTAPPEPWHRGDRRATGRLADVALVVFHAGPLADGVPMSLARFGGPSNEAVQRIDVTSIQDPAWLGGWRAGGMRAVAESTLTPAEMAALDAADRCHFVRATIADPADLTYLQASWAVARWLSARGATLVLDAFAIRFHPAERLLAEDVRAPLSVEREVAIVHEAEPELGKLGHVVHTRGLGKLARPDLVALVEPKAVKPTVALLRALAARLADGYMPTPGERPALPAELGVAPTLHPMTPGGLAESLHLNNDAWLVEVDRTAS